MNGPHWHAAPLRVRDWIAAVPGTARVLLSECAFRKWRFAIMESAQRLCHGGAASEEHRKIAAVALRLAALCAPAEDYPIWAQLARQWGKHGS